MSLNASINHAVTPCPIPGQYGMVKKDPAVIFRTAFVERTKLARQTRTQLTQEQIDTVLGIDQGRYTNYERNRPLPHELVDAYCLISTTDPNWLSGFNIKTNTHQ